MAKSPEFRYATGDDLRVDLLRFREGRDVQAAPANTTQMVGAVPGAVDPLTQAMPSALAVTEEDEPKSRTGLYIALLLVLLAALAVVVFFLGKSLGWWGGSTTPTFGLPDVSGQTVAQATSTLEGRGLKVATRVDQASTASTNTVVATQPAHGTQVHRGETITLLTGSRAPPPADTNAVTVPDETNNSVIVAQQNLTNMGLQSTVIESPNCTQVNIVCDQSPTHGTKAHKGDTVTLFTAQPTTTTTTTTIPPTTTTTNPNVVIPNVQGDLPTTACNTLGQQGLNCGSQTTQPDSTVPAGRVVSTSPGGGTTVRRGSTVNLVVSSGPPTTPPAGNTAGQGDQHGGQGQGNGGQ